MCHTFRSERIIQVDKQDRNEDARRLHDYIQTLCERRAAGKLKSRQIISLSPIDNAYSCKLTKQPFAK